MDKLPIVYVRGYAGPTAGVDAAVDDPFYGFNRGATHVRVGGDGDPMFYQFEGPLLRLMTDEGYELPVRGNQRQYLADAANVPVASLWVHRFYDQAATTFMPPPHQSVLRHVFGKLHQQVTADGFDIESAAKDLYELITAVRDKSGAPKVYLVAHSMGGLVARCMMQKICREPGARRLPAKELVAKFFTYGTPHGGIAFQLGALDWAEETFGPVGSSIFAPEKMYGYLTPGASFGDVPPRGTTWDPQEVPEEVFAADDIFCLIGTDPKDYGPSRLVVGPKSDGLVRIENAYVRRAHRAYVYKSHSGRYGEVNSEEGYQNLRRFLLGRWRVQVDLIGLPDTAAAPADVWQADMRLSIRGLPIVMSERTAAHWCPIQLDEEIRGTRNSTEDAVTLVTVFLLEPGRATGGPTPLSAAPHEGRMRYTLTLRVFKLRERDGGFDFADHLEQVPDWQDWLIVDIGTGPDGSGLRAWAAWNSMVNGSYDQFDPITAGLPAGQQDPIAFEPEGDCHTGEVELPPGARLLPALGDGSRLRITVYDREARR
ncbi:esterase/lipase family protein [Streptomyces anandii]|uniref:esterase/lipase family protein n=1 Tax=Streptomyces anandii TaxID=285454 RepID=UPI0036F71B43